MAKIIKLFENAKELYSRQQRKKQARRNMMLLRETERRLQVREFGGELCLCLDNVPVLERRTFDEEELRQARALMFSYLQSL